MTRRIILLRTLQIVLDVLVLGIALVLAALTRFDGAIPSQMLKRLVIEGPYVVTLQYALLTVFGVPRFSWRYVGLREALRILEAMGVGALLLTSARFIAVEFFPIEGYAQFSYLPYGVILIDCALCVLGVGGVRVARRISTEQAEIRKLRPYSQSQTRTLLIGAGRGGVMVAKEIAGRPELGVRIVGFIDDDRDKRGSVVHGIPVLGTTKELPRIARELGATEALITVPNARGSAIRSIAAASKEAGLHVKIIPGLFQLVGGELNLSRTRDVAIEDLLRRDAVVLDDVAIAGGLKGRVIAISGAGGSIGSEICRQVCRFEPEALILLERSENALFEIHRDLLQTFPSVRIEPCIADICDRDLLDRLFSKHAPTVVFHAAAHKHVPMMEWNPREAVKNNVIGTRCFADVAHHHAVNAFVMISTDKAINPTSVMGASKRVAELYVQALAKTSNTRFVTVRFGNVLGSNGSVVPIFKQQIERGGPVTVTHPDMTRYFMTIPEACQLVLQASSMGVGGEIFILDMGEPVKIVDLARDLIQLSGFDEDEIGISFTGIRPGEKLYEELSTLLEKAERTRHPKIFIGTSQAPSLVHMEGALAALAQSALDLDDRKVRDTLTMIVPEYRPSTLPPPTESPRPLGDFLDNLGTTPQTAS